MGKSTAIFDHSAAAGKQDQDISVYPAGFQNDPDEESFPISNFDYIIPKIYTLLNLYYEFDDADRASVLEDLVAGLEVTLSQYRPLAGGYHTDHATGKETIIRKRGDSVKLRVRNMDDSYPDYETLKARHFDYVMLDFDRLLPADIINTPLMTEVTHDLLPVLILQVNFIRGGLILSSALHHRCSDGTGTQGFMSQWFANTQAIKTNGPFPPFDATVLDKTPITYDTTPTPEQLASLDAAVPFLERITEAPTLASFKITPKTPILVHIPHTALTRLKSDATPSDPNTWISTYDAILSLLWRAIIRSRAPLLSDPADPKSTACIMGPINGRRYHLPTPLHPALLCNVLALPRTDLPIPALTAPDALPVVAAAIRASNRRHAHPQMFADISDWVAAAPHKGLVTAKFPPATGPATMSYNTTWRDMKYYTPMADFGYGIPAVVRRPPPTLWSGVFMNPVRPAGDGYDEFCVNVETEVAERFRADEELLRYAVVV